MLDFLTSSPQVVRIGSHTSSSLTLSTGVPQGHVLSPLLYSLFTYNCSAKHSSNLIFKFADDTTILWPMSYRDKVNLVSMVYWQQPLSKRQQDQDCGLQKVTERRSRSHSHQCGGSRESQELQVSWCTHLWGPFLEPQLQHHNENSSSASQGLSSPLISCQTSTTAAARAFGPAASF